MNGYNNNNQQFQQQPVYNPQVMNQKKTPAFAITSMCCGIASIVLCCFGIFGLASGICAIVFGILSMKKEAPNGKGMALAGLICGGIGTLLTLIVWISSCACTGCMGAGSNFLLAEMMEELMYEFY